MELRKPLILKAAQAAVIVGLGILIYWPALHGPFVFDDIYYIERNPAIKHLEKLDTIFSGNVTPLRFLPFWSFAVNYHYHRLDVFGFHAVNLAIHLINALLVWWLGALILRSKEMEQRGEGHWDWIPYLSALIFLAHPLATQAVSYVSQRFTSMVTMFYLLTLCLYAAHRLSGRAPLAAASWLCAVAAMFSKQIAITLPLAVLLLDRAFFKSKKSDLLGAFMVYCLIALIIPYFHHFAVGSMLSISQSSGSHMGDHLNPLIYLLTQFRVICVYLKLFVFPVGQNFLYDFPASQSLLEPGSFLSLTALVMLFLMAGLCSRDDRLIGFGILWFFLTLSVESSVITIGHVIFEHRAYLPSVGLCLASGIFMGERIRKKELFAALSVVLIIILSVLTYQRNKVWSDAVLFWGDVVKKSPELAKAHLNLGVAYAGKEQWPEAIASYEKAIVLDEGYEEAYNNRGVVYMKKKDYGKALKDFNKAIEIDGNYLNGYYNRGTVHNKLRRFSSALTDLNRAIELNQSHPESHNERGAVLLFMHKTEEALLDFHQAILYDPGYVEAYNNRGVTYNELREYDIAVRDLKQAIRLDPSFAAAYYNLSFSYLKKGEFQKAWDNLEKAKELKFAVDPEYARILAKAVKK